MTRYARADSDQGRPARAISVKLQAGPGAGHSRRGRQHGLRHGPVTGKGDEPCKGGRATDSLVQRPNSHHDSSEQLKSHFRAPIFQNRCTIKEDEDERLIRIRFAPLSPNGARFSADFVFEMHTTFHAYPALFRLRVARRCLQCPVFCRLCCIS